MVPHVRLEELTASGFSDVYCGTKVVEQLENIFNGLKTLDEKQ